MIEKLIGNVKKGLVFVVSAPAGTGKTTLVNMLVTEFPSVVENISFTTRKKREGEINAVHYHFVKTADFEEKIRQGDFLEYVTLYGDYYGTDRQTVVHEQEKGKHVILVIDTQGAMKLKNSGFNAAYIFIAPPSMEELKKRLSTRKTESESVINKRLEWAKQEIAMAKQYDYYIVNDDLMTAYHVLRSIVVAEEHKMRKI